MPDRRESRHDSCHQARRCGERRRSSRCETDAVRVWVTRRLDGAQGCVQGRLRDLSISGASLLIEESPPAGSRIQIRFETRPSVPAVKGTAVRVTEARRFPAGPLVVSPTFANPCPYELFRSPVYGN